jgi:hypothetical protein
VGDLDRAAAALDDAFVEQVKARFDGMCSNIAGGEPVGAAAIKFSKGIIQVRQARAAAAEVIKAAFS